MILLEMWIWRKFVFHQKDFLATRGQVVFPRVLFWMHIQVAYSYSAVVLLVSVCEGRFTFCVLCLVNVRVTPFFDRLREHLFWYRFFNIFLNWLDQKKKKVKKFGKYVSQGDRHLKRVLNFWCSTKIYVSRPNPCSQKWARAPCFHRGSLAVPLDFLLPPLPGQFRKLKRRASRIAFMDSVAEVYAKVTLFVLHPISAGQRRPRRTPVASNTVKCTFDEVWLLPSCHPGPWIFQLGANGRTCQSVTKSDPLSNNKCNRSKTRNAANMSILRTSAGSRSTTPTSSSATLETGQFIISKSELERTRGEENATTKTKKSLFPGRLKWQKNLKWSAGWMV